MINNNDVILKEAIVGALTDAYLTMPTYNDDGTTKPEDEWIVTPIVFDGANVYFDGATDPEFATGYSTDKETWVDKVVESISKEVVSYMVANADVAMKSRMDKLEQDYNVLLTTLAQAFIPSVGITPPGAVTIVEYNAMVALVQSSIVAGGGTTRQADTTTPEINTNELIDGVPVQIK